MMPEAKCPGCGEPLPADALGGFCPRCLLGAVEGDAPTFLPMATKHFGDYELLQEIARGGMGVVYKARQLSLDRTVAVKMILAGPFTGKQFVQRFRGEAAAAGLLKHPNIISIHEIGMHDDRHFFSMDYVEGQNLAQLVGARPLPSEKAARYVKLIAEAIHYAHEQGILHRDLKPSNVLVEAATDQPRVTDFGLAKRLDSVSSLTVTGQMLGSPNFMPPEQAGSERAKIGRHSDVYALGGILYYLLTARAPFQADSLEAIMRDLLSVEPIAPRLLNPSVPRDLETICLKCLEKLPEKRYGTAQELADELERFHRHEPIQARPVTRAERAWRWCLRNPVLASTFGAGLVLLLVVAIGGPIAVLRINEARKTTQENLYAADINLAQRALAEGDLGRTLQLLNAYRPVRGPTFRIPSSAFGEDLRGWEWRYLWKQCQSDELLTLGQHSNAVAGVAFSPDGALLASASLDRTVKLWDMPKRRLAATLAHPDPVAAVAFSPDGTLLATGGADPFVRLWNTTTWEEAGRFQAQRFAHGRVLVFTPDGCKLAALDTNNAIGIWDVRTNARLLTLAGHNDSVTSLVFTPDGTTLVSGSRDSTIRIWDAATGSELGLLTNMPALVYALAISPNGQMLAAGTAGRTDHLKLFDLPSRRELAVLSGHTRYISSLAFSPDSKLLVSASADHSLRVWDTATRKEINTLRGHMDRLHSVAFSPHGQLIATGGFDGSVKLWLPTRRPAEQNRISFAPTEVAGSALSPDATRFIAWQRDGACRLWDVRALAQLQSFALSRSNLTGVAISNSGILLAAADATGDVEVIDMATRRSVAHFRSDSAMIQLVFSPDSNWLAGGVVDERVVVWNVPELKEAFVTSRAPRVGAIAFSPDSRTLATGASDGHVDLWSLPKRERILQIAAHQSVVTALGFSPNGAVLASGGLDGASRLWDVDTGKQLGQLTRQLLPARSFGFSEDARRLVAGFNDGTVKVWDLATGRELVVFPGPDRVIREAVFLDEHTLVNLELFSLVVRRAATKAEVDLGPVE